MKSTSIKEEERRQAERRTAAERRDDVVRATTGDRRVVENRGVAAAMVDALEDILQWEKTSERSLKVAAKVINNDEPSN